MNYGEAKESFERLFEHKLSSDEARSFLVELYERGENMDEIAAAATVMREHSVKLPIGETLREKLFDNCGTGGDKSGSFNISTTVSIVLAATGMSIAKHGNRSITSKSGSADVLEKLGVNLNLTPLQQVRMLEETGFAFIFAINHHLAMKFIMPIRKSLPHRTIFNILGPLTNPTGVKRQLVGVFDKAFIPKVIGAMKIGGSESAMVVSSRDGMDEIAISDITYYARLVNGEIIQGEIVPEDYGLKRANFKDILGGEVDLNAKILKGVISTNIKGAMRDIVLLNAATALMIDEKARDIQEGLEIAKEAIDSRRALEKLNEIIKVSQTL